MSDHRAPAPGAVKLAPLEESVMGSRNLNLFYEQTRALHDVTVHIPRRAVTAIIGPSGCGKSTLLRCFNRMNDLVHGCRVEGQLFLRESAGTEVDLYDKSLEVMSLRRRVGMVFQRPAPFPKSIFENVAYGLRIQGRARRKELEGRVEVALKQAALWDEVKDRLNDNALALSGGQQQRLVIARAVAVEPEVLLLDEPASALDPRSTRRIEELITELSSAYTIAIVTHNMQQATRVSRYTAFMYVGQLVEFGRTEDVFTRPIDQRTEHYVTGRFG